MSRVVHKYELEIEPLGTERTIKIGQTPMFLHVDKHKNDIRRLFIWFEVDDVTDPPGDDFAYCVLGTGRPTDIDEDDRIHLGTVIDDPYVWHVYEVFHDVVSIQEETSQ